MQLSAKTQNACLAALELARRCDNPQPVCLKTIADEQGMSSQFLVQILLQLKRAGIVKSSRGPSGGYRLTMEPCQISLLDIVSAMEGTASDPTCPNEQNPIARVFFDAWSSLAQQQRQRLSEVNLEMLVAAAESPAGDTYYI
jgi:Rrf2 family protein